MHRRLEDGPAQAHHPVLERPETVVRTPAPEDPVGRTPQIPGEGLIRHPLQAGLKAHDPAGLQPCERMAQPGIALVTAESVPPGVL